MPATLISTRLEKGLLRQVDLLARRQGRSRSLVLRQLIEVGLRRAQLRDAIEAYRTGKLSFGAAAAQAGLSLWEFREALLAERIPMPRTYGIAEAEEDVTLSGGRE